MDTLHKKNLLLLGEDRYLSTLMLKTFPHRKQIFVPQAVCKTIVPDSFSVLLSQRRRWINSTVHNLMELFLVRDLCGTFCFSMQVCHVMFRELISVCCVYRVGRNLCSASSHWIYGVRRGNCDRQTTYSNHPAMSPWSHPRTSSGSDCVDGQAMVLRWLDVYLPYFLGRMEFHSSNIRILEFR